MQHRNKPHRNNHRRLPVAVLALALLVGACGNGGDSTAGTGPAGPPPSGPDPTATSPPETPTQPTPTTADPATTTQPADGDGGWLGGEPVWISSEGELESAAAAEAAVEYSAAEAPPPPAPAPEPAVAVTIDIPPAAADESVDGSALEVDDSALEGSSVADGGRLTGGSINDNEHFEDYLAYRDGIVQLGIPVRDLDPRGRIVVTVTGGDGRPAAGTEVEVAGGGVEVSLRTTADGTARFHPGAYGAGDGPFTVTVGEVSAQTERGGSVALQTDRPTASGDVALDVLFLLDATGSMADEIDQLKFTIGEVAQRIGDLPANVDLHLGMTLYRDIGDTFVTANFNFTSDVDHFTRALEVVVADGGGDYAEALDEALADALGRPTWRPAGQAVQLVFLIADAPPQIARQVPTPYTESMINAAGRGIKIFPVSSSGTDDQAEYVFRQLAQFTGGRYVFLTYGAGGRATGDATDIGERDYEELSLDDLIVRLVTEEVDALGQDPVTS